MGIRALGLSCGVGQQEYWSGIEGLGYHDAFAIVFLSGRSNSQHLAINNYVFTSIFTPVTVPRSYPKLSPVHHYVGTSNFPAHVYL